MRIAIVKNGKELGERAFLEIKKVLAEKPDAVIGFATGNTPLPLYEKMVADHKQNGTSYAKVKAFNLDEYVGVDPKDKASFARFMQDNLFSKIDIDPANADIPNGMADDLNAECARYSAMVANNPADIQILGIGVNGHIAFNEPYTKPDEPTHIALLTAQTRQDNAPAFKDPSLVPMYALTMGINEILTAKRIVLLAMGENKAEAVYNMIMGRDDTSCPAAALRKHPDVTVVLDREAASMLTFREWELGGKKEEEPTPAPSVAPAPAPAEKEVAEAEIVEAEVVEAEEASAQPAEADEAAADKEDEVPVGSEAAVGIYSYGGAGEPASGEVEKSEVNYDDMVLEAEVIEDEEPAAEVAETVVEEKDDRKKKKKKGKK